MRKFLIFTLIFFAVSASAVDIDKKTLSALENIRQGYMQYGFNELRKVAITNGLAAQFYVAVCYENGIGVDKNLTDAFKMYRKAAERGLPDAMFHIASFYRDGVVVAQDTSREKEWLQRFNQKGGQLLLPDIMQNYHEGLQHANNYALNPQVNNNLNIQQTKQNEASQQRVDNLTNIKKQQTSQTDSPISVIPPKEKKSDVDQNIPNGKQTRLQTFALIISNENYMDVDDVPNALNDGKVFAEYCKKTLGLPDSNVRLVTDATLNRMRSQLNWLMQVMDAFKGEANIIFYYAGHGIPDETNFSSYLLPTDGYGSDVNSGISLNELYSKFSKKKSKSIVILLDACFSGANRNGNMLTSARGVAIKAKQNVPKGNMVVLSAAQGDETAYPYSEKQHGMFTYYLLKKLQETKGDVTLGELGDYLTNEVMKQSIVINGKLQTPQTIPSETAVGWKKWIFK